MIKLKPCPEWLAQDISDREISCPICNSLYEQTCENVGFNAPDPERWIIESYCPNGCQEHELEEDI